MDDRVNPWFLLGGFLLAANAGAVNVVMLQVFHVPVSHMTGAASAVSFDLVMGLTDHLALIVSIMGGFLVGAILSGLIVGAKVLKAGRRYGAVLMIEGLLLMAAAGLATSTPDFAVVLAAIACGLQNAMAASYHGAVIRTTHVTGIVTDIGMMLGHALKRHRVAWADLFLLACLVIGFLLGGVYGVIGYLVLELAVLWIPAIGLFIGGLGYYLVRVAVRRRQHRLSHAG